MEPQPSRAPRVTFGPFEYDRDSGDLTKLGTPLRLNGKPLQILSLLVGRPGQLVTREELQQHLWQGTTFVDFEQNLNSAINRLRQTLGDSADTPRYIATVPGRGYRFLAPVQRTGAVVHELPAPPISRLESDADVRPSWRPPAIGALGLALLAAAAYWFWSRAATPVRLSPPVTFAIHPPNGFALEGGASRQSIALSPDGSKIAFTAMDASGAFSLFVRDFQSLDLRKIPGTEGTHTMFWAPDGRSLYVTARGKIWRAPLGGDAHLFLAEAPTFMFSGLWLSPQRLLIDAWKASYTAGTGGGALQPLKGIYWWPQLMPDGKHLLCLMGGEKTHQRWVRIVRLSDFAVVKQLFPSNLRVEYIASTARPEIGHLLYVRAGVLLAQPFDPRSWNLLGDAVPIARSVYTFGTGAADFSVSLRGTIAYQNFVSRTHLAWVDRAGHEVGTIGPASVNVKAARLSPDGKWAATALYNVETGWQDLWIFNVKTNAGRRLSAETDLRDAAVWSPDSKRIAFMGGGEKSPGVQLRGLGEADAEETTPRAGFLIPLDWSSDGRFVAFMTVGLPRFANEQQSDVSMFDLAQGKKIVPLLNSRFHESWGAFSPDGKWFAFTSDQSGKNEVYVQAFRAGGAPGLTGSRYLASTGGGSAVRWRRDGRELYFLNDAGMIQAVPVSLGAEPKFGKPVELFAISTEARAAIHSLPGFDVSQDGSRFLIPVVSAAEGPSIVVVQNWEGLLGSDRVH